MAILLLLVFGLPIGFLARAAMPDSPSVTWLVCGGLGAFIAGFLVRLVAGGMSDFDAAGLIGVMVMSPLLLVIFGRPAPRPVRVRVRTHG
ncbi:MAG TPA: hypothetical protein VEQ58_06095 [Polyangiaceae bacterium]|nr:hypothetical protein [Polyangiaceae bacterium]